MKQSLLLLRSRKSVASSWKIFILLLTRALKSAQRWMLFIFFARYNERKIIDVDALLARKRNLLIRSTHNKPYNVQTAPATWSWDLFRTRYESIVHTRVDNHYSLNSLYPDFYEIKLFFTVTSCYLSSLGIARNLWLFSLYVQYFTNLIDRYTRKIWLNFTSSSTALAALWFQLLITRLLFLCFERFDNLSSLAPHGNFLSVIKITSCNEYHQLESSSVTSVT